MFVSNFAKIIGNKTVKRKQPTPGDSEPSSQPKRPNLNKDKPQTTLSKLPTISQLDVASQGGFAVKALSEDSSAKSNRHIIRIDRSAPKPPEDSTYAIQAQVLKRQQEQKQLLKTKDLRRKQWVKTPHGILIPPLSDPIVVYAQFGLGRTGDSDDDTFPIPIRITLTTKDDDVVYDTLIVPKERVVDYCTDTTHIKPNHLRFEQTKNKSFSHPTLKSISVKPYQTCREEVSQIINNRIVIGYHTRKHLLSMMHKHETCLIRDIADYPMFRNQKTKDGNLLHDLSMKYTPEYVLTDDNSYDSILICNSLGKLYMHARVEWEKFIATKYKRKMTEYRKLVARSIGQMAKQAQEIPLQQQRLQEKRMKKREKDLKRREKRWESHDNEDSDDGDDDDDDDDDNDDSNSYSDDDSSN